jgi:hypothetical protein
VSTFVDTSVSSLAFRRDTPLPSAEVEHLVSLIKGGQILVSTGLVPQELLQGFTGSKAREQILEQCALALWQAGAGR